MGAAKDLVAAPRLPRELNGLGRSALVAEAAALDSRRGIVVAPQLPGRPAAVVSPHVVAPVPHFALHLSICHVHASLVAMSIFHVHLSPSLTH
jgi:hypothetical protein